jgi:hypothetical protein
VVGNVGGDRTMSLTDAVALEIIKPYRRATEIHWIAASVFRTEAA